MDLEKVERAIKLMQSYNLTELEVKDGESSIKLSQNYNGGTLDPLAFTQGALARSTASTHHSFMPPSPTHREDSKSSLAGDSKSTDTKTEALIDVKAPFVGTFYAAANPDTDPFTGPGQKVGKGQVVCIIEAMKIMNEIETECKGEVVEVCVENGDAVEFDQVLFRLRP